jgi:1-deoxy-D-xylulose-5-phosphate synthase
LEFAHDNGYSNQIMRLGIPDQFIDHGEVHELLNEIGLTSDHIVQTIRTMLQKQKKGLEEFGKRKIGYFAQ